MKFGVFFKTRLTTKFSTITNAFADVVRKDYYAGLIVGFDINNIKCSIPHYHNG